MNPVFLFYYLGTLIACYTGLYAILGTAIAIHHALG